MSMHASSDVPSLDPAATRAFVERAFASSIVPTLIEYIKIPNKSPSFDPDWEAGGHMERAVSLLSGWAREHALPDMTLDVVRLEGRTPVIVIEIPGVGDDTVLLYGHLDKQPEMVGWDEGKGPWTPVLDGDLLYGRGGADDGYAIFASLTAVAALHDQGVPHARCVILIEACEESGSYDLPYYIDALAGRIGTPSLVVCLDSGCGNYDQLWCTTSLRGLAVANLRVSLLREGVHSGDASGIVASSFRVLRHLLDRLEDSATGGLRLPELYVDIPADRVDQARAVAGVLGEAVWDKLPVQSGVRPTDTDPVELILSRTWRPTLSVTGAAGLPALRDAGNVLRPETSVKLSIRLPPTLPATGVLGRLEALLCSDPPYGAEVRLERGDETSGWNAPPVAAWLEDAMARASRTHFGKDAVYMGEGGSIPFMGMLGEKFPEAQFMITGVLGPGSNAHGPNEFLHVPMARKLTCCVADVLRDHLVRAARA